MAARSRKVAALTASLVLLFSCLIAAVQQAAPAHAVDATRILVTGDSITQGSSGDYTWRYRLWSKLQSTSPGGVTFVGPTVGLYDNVNNAQGSPYYAVDFPGRQHGAKWGTTFGEQLNLVSSQVANSQADVLVVALGFNDLSYHTSPAQTIANAKLYIERARAARPGLDVVITEVTSGWDPWANGDRLLTETGQYADLLVGLRSDLNTSSERVEIAHTLQGWNSRVHTWDGVHPNPTGETVIAQRVSEALSRLGIGTSTPSIIADTPWGVAGPAPGVAQSAEQATLSWSRTSTGATGMYIHYRLTQAGPSWDKLPYAVGEGDSWNMKPLVAGGIYEFALSPSKGFLAGARGPSVQRTIASESFAPTVSDLSARKDGEGIRGFWGPSSNASGYLIGYRTMSSESTVEELPYPVGNDVFDWKLTALDAGRYYQFMVRPTRGFVKGTWTSSTNVRSNGLPYHRAYIALGDSYSSGLGAWESVGAYDLGEACRRTSAAWAFQMQKSAQISTKLVACQGDTLTTGEDGGVRSQLSAIKPFFDLHPKSPQLVTVTVGGNDVGFGAKVRACMFSNCTTLESQWISEIAAMFDPLHDFYDDLRDVAPNADIVVGGYPHVIEVNGTKVNATCSLIGSAKRQMMVRLVDRLNGVIHGASEGSVRLGTHKSQIWSAGSQVVDRFASHAACQYGEDEWIHSYTTGGGMSGGAGMNTFHPKQSGQLAYALAFGDAIMQEVQ